MAIITAIVDGLNMLERTNVFRRPVPSTSHLRQMFVLVAESSQPGAWRKQCWIEDVK